MVDRSEYVIDHAIAEGMEVLLADVIRKYPIIYDKDIKHKNGKVYNEKCEIAWNKISDELNLELDSCKSLWSCIKQKFIKYRKRMDYGEPVATWPTYNILHKWLDKHVKKRKSRHDYIKQMKLPKTAQTKNEATDDDNEPDEEWTEIIEDKETTVQVKLKRKSDNSNANESGVASPKLCKTRFEPKQFNIEVVSENEYEDRELFSESDRKNIIKEAEIVVLEESRAKQSTPQIEIIDVNETKTDNVQMERFLNSFTTLFDRINSEAAVSDSNDAFGRYIASMVRELPAQKRIKVRLNILQYASDLIASETSPNN